MRLEKSCRLPKTHNRLRQFHDLWHEAASAYPDPDEFVTKLNACIQAARSVTFVLQKEHSKSDGFETWYGEWQSRMRDDPVMRWLVEARNEIEKEGDLDTASQAIVTLAINSLEEELAKLDVPPLISPAEVAALFPVDGIDQSIRDDALLIVERRWITVSLPDRELLDALAHCYGVLAAIVAEAHERLGIQMQTFGGENHEGPYDRVHHPAGRLPCMTVTARIRTAFWHLGLDSLMQLEESSVDLSRETIDAEVIAAYGDLDKHRIHPSLPAEVQAAGYHQIGRHMLVIDGSHGTYAWLQQRGNAPSLIWLHTGDQQDKALQMRQLASEVDRVGANAVFISAEVWLAPTVGADDPRARLRAGERGDRTEAFVTYLLQHHGPNKVWMSPFDRDSDGRIQLADAEVMDLPGDGLHAPILRTWERWPSGVGSGP